MSRQFSLADRLRSFRFAYNGLRYLVTSEHNARLHLLATIVVVVLGILTEISLDEWRWLFLAIALVWSAEAFNTALERLGDAVSLEHNPKIGHSKDVAATAVMIASLLSVLIGLTIFGPYLVKWLAS